MDPKKVDNTILPKVERLIRSWYRKYDADQKHVVERGEDHILFVGNGEKNTVHISVEKGALALRVPEGNIYGGCMISLAQTFLFNFPNIRVRVHDPVKPIVDVYTMKRFRTKGGGRKK